MRVAISGIKKQVKQFYDEAGVYFSKTRERKRKGDANWEEVSEYLRRVKEGERVLDLGCGNGRLLTGLPKSVGYVGVDFSKTLLEKARQLHPGRKFVWGDITEEKVWQKIGKDRFEAVFCVATLHHVPHRAQQLFVLQKAGEVLKKKGFLYVSVWNLWQRRYWRHHLDIKAKMKNVRWVYVPFMNKWKRFCFAFDKAYLAKLIIEAGYRIEKLFYAGKRGEEVGWEGGRNLVAVGRKG